MFGLKQHIQPKPYDAPYDCKKCPRLVGFLEDNKRLYPDYHNAPVASFGDDNAQLLIIGLAPGLQGANQTGRPFTGDYAGDLLYETLAKFGYTRGNYGKHADDGLELINAQITNAVRCVPPQNKPIGEEVNNCRPYLINQIKDMPNLKCLMVLGKLSHDTTLKSLGYKLKDFPFGHMNCHTLDNGLTLVDSYHCSRYNTNTGKLTVEMFENVFKTIDTLLKQ